VQQSEQEFLFLNAETRMSNDFCFSVVLTVDQMSTLENALSHYLAVCERKVADGINSPFCGDRENIKRILRMRYAHVHTPAGTFSSTQIEEMARTGQLPKALLDE
jgi:hypothetical protein